MRNIITLISCIFFFVFTSLALAEPITNDKKTPEAIELKLWDTNKKLILPPYSGFVLDKRRAPPAHLKGRVAMLVPSVRMAEWEPHKLGLTPEELGAHIWVNANDGRNRIRNRETDSIEVRVEEWRGNASENRVIFGDIPDSSFWYSGGPKLQHLTIYAYTILNNQLILMTFGRVPEETPATQEWLEAQQQEVVGWVRQLRATNKQ